MLINDLNFNAIVDGRVVVVDTASADHPLKAIVRSAQFGNSLLRSASETGAVGPLSPQLRVFNDSVTMPKCGHYTSG